MKVAIIETSTSGLYTAHFRNSYILAQYFNADFLYKGEQIKEHWINNYDVIIISYASFYFEFQPFIEFIKKNKFAKLFWITNEYNVTMNSSVSKLLKERKYEIIANFEEKGCSAKGYRDFHFVNLNLLFAKEKNEVTEKKYDLTYYGTFRPDRETYFRTYFDERLYFSTSSTKNLKKFHNLNIKFRPIHKLDWTSPKETLNHFYFSLYIEDRFIHNNFHNLANRFYEALFCNVVQFFDINCKNTIERSGLEKFNEYYFVSSKEELWNKISESKPEFNKHLTFQTEWNDQALQQKKELFSQLTEILSK